MSGLPTKLVIFLKPKRRWAQFSLGSLFVLVTALCSALAWWVVPAERQRRAVAAIEALEGQVFYEDGDETQEAAFPKRFLRRWLPTEYVDHVKGVNFWDSKLTDDDLSCLQNLPRLRWLTLDGTRATGAGLERLQSLTGLERLSLFRTEITDADLANLKYFADLEVLHLDRTQITNAGLLQLQVLRKLRWLTLDETQITDAGLPCLRPLTGLEELWLIGTAITGSGLSHLQSLPNLKELRLNDTQLTDAGLVQLERLQGLEKLDVRGARVSPDGLARLQRALSGCQIIER